MLYAVCTLPILLVLLTATLHFYKKQYSHALHNDISVNNGLHIQQWFKRFKNCYSLLNVKVSGESVSADVKAAEEFLETLDKLIVVENYLP